MKKLIELNKLIDEWTSSNAMENGFGHKWLGNIVLNSKIGTVDTDKSTDLRCRGSLIDNEVVDDILYITTETAWEPMLKMWRKIVDKYIPEAEIIYTTEEPGMCLYATNDPNLEGLYYIDVWDVDGMESEYAAGEEDVVEVLREYLKSDKSDFDELLEDFKKSKPNGIAINPWKTYKVDFWN